MYLKTREKSFHIRVNCNWFDYCLINKRKLWKLKYRITIWKFSSLLCSIVYMRIYIIFIFHFNFLFWARLCRWKKNIGYILQIWALLHISWDKADYITFYIDFNAFRVKILISHVINIWILDFTFFVLKLF